MLVIEDHHLRKPRFALEERGWWIELDTDSTDNPQASWAEAGVNLGGHTHQQPQWRPSDGARTQTGDRKSIHQIPGSCQGHRRPFEILSFPFTHIQLSQNSWRKQSQWTFISKNEYWSFKIKADDLLGVKKGEFIRYWNSNLELQSQRAENSVKYVWKKVLWTCKLYFNISLLVSLIYVSKELSQGRRLSWEVWGPAGSHVEETAKVMSVI